MASNPVSDVLNSAQLASAETALVTADPLSSFALAVQSLSLLVEETDNVEIVAVLLNEDYDEQGALYDVVDVSFRIRGRGGMFTVHPPFDVNWQAQAFVAIGRKHATVEGIYQGLASKDELPSGPLGEPLPPIGIAVPV